MRHAATAQRNAVTTLALALAWMVAVALTS
jgi:hypothetical protein